MEGDAWVEGLNIRLDRGGGVGGDRDIVEDHLHYFYLFLEVSGRWKDGADDFL